MHSVNTSYSGVDAVATITIPGRGPVVIGELAHLSYSVFRDKTPVQSMGRITPKGFTRGLRMVTGVLGFVVFDESVVYRCIEELKELGYKMFMDEMPLFDITMTFANEFGSKSTMTIFGVTTYTEGMSISIQDMMTSNAFEFYALDISPIKRLKE